MSCGVAGCQQYKDYNLFMLFIKTISYKYSESDDFAPTAAGKAITFERTKPAVHTRMA